MTVFAIGAVNDRKCHVDLADLSESFGIAHDAARILRKDQFSVGVASCVEMLHILARNRTVPAAILGDADWKHIFVASIQERADDRIRRNAGNVIFTGRAAKNDPDF